MRNLMIPALLLSLMSTSAAHAGKMVCWTDDQGRKACGDRVPPQYAKKDREVLDAQGRVIKKESRQKTPEEVAAAEAKIAAEAAEKERFEKQQKYDGFLIQTYSSAKELENSRDARLRALAGQITLSDKANADTEKTLQTLRDRVDVAKKASKEPDPKLLKQIKEYEKSLAEGKKAREQRSKDQAEVTAKFGADIERYDLLKSGKVQLGGLAPASAPESAAAPVPAPAPAPAN